MRRAWLPVGIGLMGMLALGACAAPAASEPSDAWTITGPPRDLPPDLERAEGRPAPGGGTILQPSTVRIEQGVAYRFSLGHCGLASPVDLDGSFWDPIDGFTADGQPLELVSDPEMINATGGVIAVIGDEARFQTESRAVVRFARHFGEKEFPGCA
jgi:hypothetical protein